MSGLEIRWTNASGLLKQMGALAKLTPGQVAQVGSRGLNHTGGKARTQTKKALTKQTGLKSKVINKALKPLRASASSLTYRIKARGGDISLMHFAARETRKGVSAKPWNNRQVFAGTFMKAGRFPNRVDKPNWNGQVFKRSGARTRGGSDKFEKQKSGLFIPEEMVEGESAKAFETTVERELPARLHHELRRLTGNTFS